MELGPRLIFWEMTQKCNLKCPYCRRDSQSDAGLTLERSLHIIDSIVENYRPLLIFSGGEPLIYPHFFEVATYAHKKGLKIALATNATLVDENLAKMIKLIGFHRVAISLDSANQEVNDYLRQEGTFLKAIAAVGYLRSQDIDIQINTTVLRKNFKELTSLYQLCLELGIKAWHLFAFVPVGCGISIPKQQRLTPLEYEEFLGEVAKLSLETKIEIKMTCAPHYNRVLAQKIYFDTDIRKLNADGCTFNPRLSASNPRESVFSKGCLAGSSVCFISSHGEVYPCGYLPISAGNVLKDTFKKIWQESYLFQTLRNPDYLRGRCGVCEYVSLCGGCRARAYAATTDYLEEEPDCVYQPIRLRSGLIVSDQL